MKVDFDPASARVTIPSASSQRGGWLTLAAACVLFVWTASGLAYFFYLPTDGWLANDMLRPFVLVHHIAGFDTQLQPGDRLVAIEGFLLEGPVAVPDLNAAWQAGNTLRYTVERDGMQRDIPVSLRKWAPKAAWDVFFLQNSGFAGYLIFFLVTAFTFYKRPDDPAAQALFLLAEALISIGSLVLVLTAVPIVGILPLARGLSYITLILLYALVGPPTLIRMALVFPRHKDLLKKHPWIEPLPYLVGAAFIPFFFLTNGAIGFVWTIAAGLIALALLIHSAFTMRDALSRAQLLWGLWGMILGWVLFMPSFLVKFGLATGFLGDLLVNLSNLSFGLIGVTLSVAILRYRLFDISLIIRRTLLYGVLTAVLGVVYLSGVLVLQQVFRSISGQESDLALVISTLLIAGLFNPLRRRLQQVIDLRFYRRKYDAALALQEFGASTQRDMDIAALMGRILGVVEQTVQPEAASLWLRKGQNERDGSENR
jgi:hypothetical protein